MVDAPAKRRGRTGLRALFAVGAALLAVAVGVRTIPPARATAPEDVVEEKPRLQEPMQLLARGAPRRAPELDRWVSEPRRARFKAVRQVLFALEGCPPLLDWIDAPDGQHTERLLGELRSGSREDALAALTLILQIARVCEWSPGVLGRTQHAERLGGLLQDWLRAWGEQGARDPLLSDPVLAAALVYGHVMRTAWKAPILGFNRAPYERAVGFLAELAGTSSRRSTAFGEALRSRYVRAAEKLIAQNEQLLGFEEECAALFPDLTGSCE